MGHFEAGAKVREPDTMQSRERLATIIGQSMAMRRMVATVVHVAPKDVTVLVRGETGTGKELIASLVHARSNRSQGPLVRFNCAAIPGELAEAQLFGHVQGAFTGAIRAQRGFFAQADGGTLVLDEVGELPLAIQAKLLRALQGGEIQPVGAASVERADVRVVACTNRDLAAEVRAGRFREDLYYRLAVIELIVPPLREHREDIPALAAEFARRYGKQFGDEEVRLAPALVEALCLADWPGNVRQLENAVARLIALRTTAEIGVEAFASAPNFVAPAKSRVDPESAGTLSEQLEALERRILSRVMEAAAGNQSEAARRLGLNRGSLIGRLKKYGLTTHAVLRATDQSRSDVSVELTSSTASRQAAA